MKYLTIKMAKVILMITLFVFTSCSSDKEMAKPQEESPVEIEYAGFRRSVYGLQAKNTDDRWWGKKATDFADALSSKTEAIIIQIVSVYLDDGTSQMGFIPNNLNYSPTELQGISFQNWEMDTERALKRYDEMGVKTIIQLEPGNCDVKTSLRICHDTFGSHSSVIGYGIDAEWFRTKESVSGIGEPISDTDAKEWMELILTFDKNYTLFLKHWRVDHMPQTYRHDQLWFLNDSQQFVSLNEMMIDFKNWANYFDGSDVAYQVGYPKDKVWWGDLNNPLVNITERIVQDIENAKYCFWVDFTADQIPF